MDRSDEGILERRIFVLNLVTTTDESRFDGYESISQCIGFERDVRLVDYLSFLYLMFSEASAFPSGWLACVSCSF